MPKQNKIDLSPIIDAFKKSRRNLPVQLGQAAQTFFRENITKRQGFLDKSLDKWSPLARKRTGRFKRRDKILNRTGNLLRSIKRTKTTFSEIRIQTVGINYGGFHNEGIGVPKRQFIGKSFQLERAMKRKIDRELKGFLKKGGA